MANFAAISKAGCSLLESNFGACMSQILLLPNSQLSTPITQAERPLCGSVQCLVNVLYIADFLIWIKW